MTLSFNPGWKFFKGDVTNAAETSFDDSKWSDVSAPHTYNDAEGTAGAATGGAGGVAGVVAAAGLQPANKKRTGTAQRVARVSCFFIW